MSRDQLQFSISHARVPSQPSDRLMPESMGRSFNARLLGILLHDLLDSAGGILGCSSSLEQPAIMMGGDMGRRAVAKVFPKRTYPILTSFALVNEILQFSKSTSATSILQSSLNPNARVKQQTAALKRAGHPRLDPQSDKTVETPRQSGHEATSAFFGRTQIANLPDFLRDVSPPIVIQTRLPNNSGDLRDDIQFRLSIL